MIRRSVKPWGDMRADIRCGVAARGVAAAWVKDTKLEWFMPNFDREEPEPMSADAIMAVFQGIFPESDNGV